MSEQIVEVQTQTLEQKKSRAFDLIRSIEVLQIDFKRKLEPIQSELQQVNLDIHKMEQANGNG